MLPEYRGLSSPEARKLLVKYGFNKLPEKPLPSDLSIFISQLTSPLIYILVIAGFITLIIRHFSDTAIIFLAVFINTILGFIQERKANRALFALKKFLTLETEVVRDGKIARVDSTLIVPGDIVIVNQGDKIPADGSLVEVNRLFVNEAILTGESVSVAKETDSKVMMGTTVTSGRGVFKVTRTGAVTELGKIAKEVTEPQEDTPLKKQIVNLSKQLSLLVVGLTIFVFILGIIKGEKVSEIFTTSVALAVSAIPEGLLVGMTVVLAIGMQRILARKGLVRRLVSAETLGGVTTICVDKTGTLTEGKMQVVETVGDEKEIALQMTIANDLDDPLVIAGYEWAFKKNTNHKLLITNHVRLDSLPFSPSERYFASLNKWSKDKNVIFVNGAPEALLEWTKLSKIQKSKIKNQIEELTITGKRLMGLARKRVSSDKKLLSSEDVKEGLEWVGVLAFTDPVRVSVKPALEKTKEAGIKIVVITGDYHNTASFVMKELGIEDAKLYARVTPHEKLRIVKRLKANGEVVAMMGDGVNDAPALKNADIGIVVNEASDVSRESADLVLLDSNFGTIVAAIEEGRGIFDNLRKIILYLLCDAFEEIITVVGAIIIGLPLPVTAVQILWINLVSDGFPNLALTVDPKRPDLMDEPPRSPRELLLSPWMKFLMGAISLSSGIFALLLFLFTLNTTSDLKLARSIAFATLGLNSLVYVFSVRTLKNSFWKDSLFANKYLLLAVAAGLILQIAPFVFEETRAFFDVSTLTPSLWVAAFSVSILMFIIVEGSKVLFRSRLK